MVSLPVFFHSFGDKYAIHNLMYGLLEKVSRPIFSLIFFLALPKKGNKSRLWFL
jgi:hypothetical protein